jgi:hypothetical protein
MVCGCGGVSLGQVVVGIGDNYCMYECRRLQMCGGRPVGDSGSSTGCASRRVRAVGIHVIGSRGGGRQGVV